MRVQCPGSAWLVDPEEHIHGTETENTASNETHGRGRTVGNVYLITDKRTVDSKVECFALPFF